MRALRSWPGLLGTLALAGLPAPAAAQPVGSEFQINSYTPGSQVSPSVASDASGNFVVVWESGGQDGESYGIFGQRYDTAGVAQGDEFQINSYTTDRQSDASVASAASGNFVVVWESDCRFPGCSGQDGSEQGIFGQRYDSGGVAQGDEFQINTYTTDHQGSPSVASDTSGNFVVVWQSLDQDSFGIFGQRYDSAGGTLGSEFRVSAGGGPPSVSSDASGNFVIVWASSDGSGAGIFGQRYDSEGGVQGDEFQINSYTTGTQLVALVASDASGNFVVAWESTGQDGSGGGIFGQRYDRGGVAQGDEFRVNSFTTSSQRFPSVASDASGNFVVAWSSYAQDGSRFGIFGQRYDSGGVAQGGEFQINSFTTNDQQHPSVGATGTNQFVVAWESNGQVAAFDVFGQRFPDTTPPSVTVEAPNGGEKLFTGSSYLIQWTASDDRALSSFDVFVSVDGGGSFTPIAECQNLPGSARSCLWLAPGPLSESALVRVTAEDTSGNSASDDSDAVFRIVSGTALVTVKEPNTNVEWRIGSLQKISWRHNLGLDSTFRIELDRDNDGSYEELIAAAAPANGPDRGRFAWTVTGQHSAAARVRVSWTGNPTVSDSSDVTFRITGGGAEGFEFQINTYTTSDQRTRPVGGHLIAADASGHFVVVWQSLDQDGQGFGIFGQRYDSAGAALGTEFRVNSYTTKSQRFPSVATAADGDFVVVWESVGQDGSSIGIFGQRYDSAGAALGTEFRVNSFTAKGQHTPSVAAAVDGDFVVVWTSQGQDGGNYDFGIFGQRYDSGGVAQGAEFRVNSYTTSSQLTPSVASDASGNFVVVWSSYGQDRSNYGIFGQRYDSAGVALGSEFRVNSYETSRQLFPSVASDASGNFVVAWDGSGRGDYYGIFGQRYDSAGVALGSEFRVNSFTSSRQARTSVASDASGNFVVVWESRHQDRSAYDVFGQRYDSAGGALGSEFRVNSFTLRGQRFPSVGAMGTNQFVVAWESFEQDGSGPGVFGQRYSFGADATPPSVTVEAPNGGEKLFTDSSYLIQWTASDDTALSSFDVFVSVDGGGSFTPIAECQNLPASATSCLWLAPGPLSESALVRVTAEDTSGNSASDDSDAILQDRLGHSGGYGQGTQYQREVADWFAPENQVEAQPRSELDLPDRVRP